MERLSNAIISASNKLQYMIWKQISDPEADAFAKEQEEQMKQEEEQKQRESIKTQIDTTTEKDQADQEAKAAKIAQNSKFNVKQLAGDTARTIPSLALSIILFCFMMYAGHLEANRAIGYNAPFRVLSFFYGTVFFFITIPLALYKIYGRGETLPYYSAILPLSTYEPQGQILSFLIGGFCYKEDDASRAAKAAVNMLYSEGYRKSQLPPKPT